MQKTVEVVLAEPRDVAGLTQTIWGYRKLPCKCAHMESAVFHTAIGQVEVSLCGHCFDVEAGWGMYHMPLEFYRAFTEFCGKGTSPSGESP